MMLATTRLPLRGATALAGLGFALGLSTSCHNGLTDLDFNDQAMELAASIEESCNVRLGDNEDTPTPYEIYKAEDLDACSSSCRFREPAAIQCIRKMERMASTCDIASFAVCRRVYVDCGPDFDHDRCDMGQCSVGSPSEGGGAILALGLLVLGTLARRRR